MKKVALAIALAGTLTLSGCALGFNAGTETQGNSGNGRTADVGVIQIRNATVIVDAKDTTRATLLATVINNGDEEDVLKSFTVDPAIKVTSSEIKLIDKLPVSIGYNSDVKVLFTTTGDALTPGKYVDVTFVFANNESIKMSLLVKKNTEYYSDVEIPADVPTEEPSVEPSASPSA